MDGAEHSAMLNHVMAGVHVSGQNLSDPARDAVQTDVVNTVRAHCRVPS